MTLLLPKIATSPAKVFYFRKVQEVSLRRILFILLVGLAYDLIFYVNTTKRCCTKYVEMYLENYRKNYLKIFISFP